MRIRSVSVLFALSVLAGSGLTGCSGSSDPAATSGPSLDAGDGPSQETKPPTQEPSPEPPQDLDIRSVDLTNTTWLYSDGGFGAPFEVPMVEGGAVIEENGFPAQYAVGDVKYGDIDGDGDDDAVAQISRTQDNGYKALWYVWLAQGPEAVQVKYPIAETGRCGTFVESLVIGEGAVKVTEYLRVAGRDDGVPCSDPGTGFKTRTITVHNEGADVWPVQTAPVAAWGGLCAGPKWPDTSPGIVDLWAAPSKDSAVSATASADGGAVFEQKDAPVTQRDGWALVGFRVFGVESDVGGTDMACAWALN